MVSTHLKNISQIGSFPQIGVKIKTYLKPPPSCSKVSSRQDIRANMIYIHDCAEKPDLKHIWCVRQRGCSKIKQIEWLQWKGCKKRLKGGNEWYAPKEKNWSWNMENLASPPPCFYIPLRNIKPFEILMSNGGTILWEIGWHSMHQNRGQFEVYNITKNHNFISVWPIDL